MASHHPDRRTTGLVIEWCTEHVASAVEDLDHCWKQQWLMDQHAPIDDRCRIESVRTVSRPENCGTCSGNSKVFARNPYAPTYVDGTHLDDCPTCHGSGKVYPAELVDGLMAELGERFRYLLRTDVIAVLDALNE